MGKQPAALQPAGGGEPRSRARASGTAPSTRAAAPQPQTPPPPQERRREEIVHGVRHAVAPRDGGRPDRHARFATHETEVHQSPIQGEAGAVSAPARRPGRPSYLPVWLKRAEEGLPHTATPWPAAGHPPSQAAVPEEPQAPRVGPAGVKPARTLNTQKTIERTNTLTDGDGANPDEQAPPGYATPAQYPRTSPGTPAPPGHSSPAARPQHGKPGYAAPAPSPGASPSAPAPTPTLTKSPMLRHRKVKERQPVAFCFTACCILFWLLVIAVGAAVLIIFLLYHPQSPKMRVTSATLNAGYIDELGIGGGARALNADLTVLAAIYNPNTKLHIVLRYMQLDLYFQGSMIGTQAVWPAPLHEGPRGDVLRSVHLVVSEVTMTREDVFVWQNATTKGGPVVLRLAGRFRTQLIFGRWFRFKYWVTPKCTLWLDPPPSGALRRARC